MEIPTPTPEDLALNLVEVHTDFLSADGPDMGNPPIVALARRCAAAEAEAARLKDLIIKKGSLTLREMQRSQPWTVPYSSGFQGAAGTWVPYLYGTHTVLHAAKSIGKLASVFEALDHREASVPTTAELETIEAMSADLVTAALRLANLFHFDLEAVLCKRVQEKNGVGFELSQKTPDPERQVVCDK